MKKEKLKTLKEIPDRITGLCVNVNDLKAEAVKWLKHFYTLQGEGDWSDLEIEAIEYFIQTFFNLTEEELKE